MFEQHNEHGVLGRLPDPDSCVISPVLLSGRMLLLYDSYL